MWTQQEEMERLEKEISERRDQLNALKRSVAATVDKAYSFVRNEGDISLSDLFGDKDDLILVHNMGRRCPYCTMWGDGLNGLLPHLANRASFIVVSPDSPDVQKEFAESRGWRFPMVSDSTGDFTRDMGYLTEQNGQTYWLPGYSTFHREADGTIKRVAADFFGPGDNYCGAWHMFDLLDAGPGDWQPAIRYGE